MISAGSEFNSGKSGDFESSSFRRYNELDLSPSERIQQAISSNNWTVLKEVLLSLKPENRKENGELLNRNRFTLPILHSMILRDAPADIIAIAIDVGADPNRRVDQTNRATKDKFLNFTPLMCAISVEKLEIVNVLCSKGVSRDGALKMAIAVEKDEPRPLMTELLLAYGEKLGSLSEGALKNANLRGLKISEDLSRKDLSGANLIDTDVSDAKLEETLVTGAWRSPETLFPTDYNYRKKDFLRAKSHPEIRSGDYFSDLELRSIFDAEKYKLIHSQSGLPAGIILEVDNLVKGSGSHTDGILYLLAYTNMVRDFPNGSPKPLVSLMPRLLFSYPVEATASLLSSLETRMDGFRENAPGNHPNMADLFVKIADPRDSAMTSSMINRLSLTITSVDRWIGAPHHIFKTSNLLLFIFSEIGLLSYDFPSVKFDTERVTKVGDNGKYERLPALIEKFGANLIEGRASDFIDPNNKKLGHKFGPGYEFPPHSMHFLFKPHAIYGSGHGLEPFRSQMYVEFRRSYYLISDPEHGTLIIRNSSPDFGRDKLPDVAFWSPKGIENGFTREQLKGFDESLLNEGGFRHITDPDLYHDLPKMTEHLSVLIKNLRGLRDYYDDWKFDSNHDSAWEQPETEGADLKLKGAYLSPGFKDLVDQLEAKLQSNVRINLERAFSGESPVPMQELAVIPRYPRRYPAWAPYRLTPALDGKPAQYQIPVTRETIDVMRGLMDGIFGGDENDSTGVINLFQRAIDENAVLVMVNPMPPEW